MLGRDTKTDVAVLKVKTDKKLVAATWGDSDKSRVGDWVLAIGNPFGLGGSVTAGILSARQRDINSGSLRRLPADRRLDQSRQFGRPDVQHGRPGHRHRHCDLFAERRLDRHRLRDPVQPGEGGRRRAGSASPTTWCVAAGSACASRRSPTRLPRASGSTRRAGRLVASVNDNGPAQTSGIQPGDVILSFDGKNVNDMKHLPRLVAETPVGKTVPVTVWRKRQRETLQVSVGRLDETEQVAAKETPKNKPLKEKLPTVTTLGLTLSNVTPELKEKFSLSDDKGVVVVESSRTARRPKKD